MTQRIFYIAYNFYGDVVVLYNDREFYRARNREFFAAVAECYAFLSSWSNSVINVDEQLQKKFYKKKE